MTACLKGFTPGFNQKALDEGDTPQHLISERCSKTDEGDTPQHLLCGICSKGDTPRFNQKALREGDTPQHLISETRSKTGEGWYLLQGLHARI